VSSARRWRAGSVHRERKKWRVTPQGGKACSICRDGLCNALILNARLAATGCGPPIPEENFVAIAALRSTMSRLRWAHACGCVLVRWAVTVRRAVRQDASGNRRERSSGPLVPVHTGTSRPRNFFPQNLAVADLSSKATLGCVNFAIAHRFWLSENSENHTARSGCATKMRSESAPEMGRAAGGGFRPLVGHGQNQERCC